MKYSFVELGITSKIHTSVENESNMKVYDCSMKALYFTSRCAVTSRPQEFPDTSNYSKRWTNFISSRVTLDELERRNWRFGSGRYVLLERNWWWLVVVDNVEREYAI